MVSLALRDQPHARGEFASADRSRVFSQMLGVHNHALQLVRIWETLQHLVVPRRFKQLEKRREDAIQPG